MINRDKVFDAFRNCITEPKCKDCPWEQCEQFNQKKTEIPVTLALDVIELLKEHEIVRCKDCKHRPTKPNNYKSGFDLEFPDGKCPCQCADGWYSWYPPDDWFCADGERR